LNNGKTEPYLLKKKKKKKERINWKAQWNMHSNIMQILSISKKCLWYCKNKGSR